MMNSILLTLCLVVFPLSAWSWDLARWDQHGVTFHNLKNDAVEGSLRLRVAKGSMKGTMRIPLPQEKKGRFLRLVLGNIEHSLVKPSVNGQALFSGSNLFRLPETLPAEIIVTQQNYTAENDGPWVDYTTFDQLEKISDSFEITVDGTSGGDLRVGDTLIIRFHGGVEKVSEAFFFIEDNGDIREYRFNGMEGIPLREVEPGLREARLTIDQQSPRLKTVPGGQTLCCRINADGFNHYFTLSTPIDIATETVLDMSRPAVASPEVLVNRNLWYHLTEGINLALGKPLVLVPPPVYTLTTGPEDTTDLTDGKLTTMNNDKIWWDRHAVGWSWINSDVLIRVDLGSVQPVEKLVIRCLGGAGGSDREKFPDLFEVFASKDGLIYHETGCLSKVTVAEQRQSDFVNYYYLPEVVPGMSQTYMHPFAISVKAETRFLILKMRPPNATLFADELAVIKGDIQSADFNLAYQKPGREIPLGGITAGCRDEVLDVIQGVLVPQEFILNDLRSGEEQKAAPLEKLILVLEMPEGLRIVAPEIPVEEFTIGGQSYRRQFIKMVNYGSGFNPQQVYFAADKTKFDAPVRVYVRHGSTTFHVTEVPIRAHWRLPAIPEPFRRLHLSLGWMAEVYARQWPQFFENYRRLGFNAVPTFPQYPIRWDFKGSEWLKEFWQEIRRQDMKVVMIESPLHEMANGHKADSEVFCKVPGQQAKSYEVCPSYRGKYYQQEMARIERCARLTAPDYVFCDMEMFSSAQNRCVNCLAAASRQDKPLAEFLLDLGTAINRDIRDAILRGATAAGHTEPPVIGGYHREPINRYFWVEDFFRTYPKYLNLSMPSLYVAGQVPIVHANIRDNYRLLRKKDIIPWLTPGTFGAFPPMKIEQMVLESLLNGSCGVTYFCSNDFAKAPLSFYYHACALALLRPYENLILDGEILEPKGNDPGKFYSGVGSPSEMLLLVGNYLRCPEKTTVQLGFHPGKCTDIRDGLDFVLDGETLSFEVPKDGIRLFYLTK